MIFIQRQHKIKQEEFENDDVENDKTQDHTNEDEELDDLEDDYAKGSTKFFQCFPSIVLMPHES